MSTSSPVPVSMVNGKKLPKVFFTRSENEEDVAAFSINSRIMVLSAGEPPTVGFSIERMDSSEISSRSRVQVEVAKSWLCSMGVDSLVNLLFLLFYVSLDSPPEWCSDGSLFPTLPFCLRRPFDSLF